MVRSAAGPQARLVGYDGPERFDILNLLVATDGAVADLRADVRRLRSNLLIGDVPPNTEHQWPGHALVIGAAVIGIHSVRQRCIVTSIDPDTGRQDPDVFRRIRQRFANQLALNAWVIRPGTIHLGHTVTRQAATTHPRHTGGWILGAPYRLWDPQPALNRAAGPASGPPLRVGNESLSYRPGSQGRRPWRRRGLRVLHDRRRLCI